MQPMCEVSFHWNTKYLDVKEAVIAVTKAVVGGYNTKASLEAALPQFSRRRIALAIDLLISAELADVKLGILGVKPDMNVVFELIKDRKFLLPMTLEAASAPGMRRNIIHGFGCKNPAGVELLLWMKILRDPK